MESDSQTAPSKILSHNRNLLSCDSNNPLKRVRGFFGFHYSSRGTAWLVPWFCGFAVLLKGFGSDILLGAPITRLIELAVCRQYLSIHNPDLVDKDGYVDEVHCKVDDIQVEMALILGVVGSLSALIGTCRQLSWEPWATWVLSWDPTTQINAERQSYWCLCR